MNDITFFPSDNTNYFTSVDLAWAPHFESLLHIYIKYDNQVQEKLEQQKWIM